MGWDTPTYPQMDGMERNGRIENVCVCMKLMCVYVGVFVVILSDK